MNNKPLMIALIAVAILAGGGYASYRFGVQQGMQNIGTTATGAEVPANNGRKVLYWHDPMVPAQKFDKPGKSPFMDMQLIPVYADEGDPGSVTINPRVQQNLGVRTTQVMRGNLASTLSAVGNIAYDERDMALVQARSNGFVEKLFVRAPWDPVKKGQALAELYVPEWVAAQEEWLTISQMQTNDRDALLDAARQRMRLAGMSNEQIHQVELLGKVQARITLIAPMSGIITELAVREGMTVAVGTPLFRINGLSTVWVNADVPESLAAQVQPGNLVEARTPSLPGVVFKGKVNAILPQVDPITRTLKARIALNNPLAQLVPGMFITLDLVTKARNDVLFVPTEAIIQTGTRVVVIVAQEEGRFMPVEVETGAESHGHTQILKGLEAGQKIVISSQFLIDSEASLKGSSTRMSDMPASDNSQGSGPVHRAEGKVEKLGKDDITISHGPISSLQWGPMTMNFKLPVAGLPGNIAVGDTVIFEIRAVPGGQFEIVTIAPAVLAPNGAMP
ncbi:efflux RND transporter periplasmic adaptor subunit [Ampullimonas aquatilis]|uniref:efflux RND transporter periplasmic adaptor subunit n=1 Tax=Ampullimonas aquatilis TaxID=1341549 RepID=UPI003C78C03B